MTTEKRGDFPDTNAYFVLYAYSSLDTRGLYKEGVEILASQQRRVRKIKENPERVLGDPRAFKSVPETSVRHAENSADFITAWARPVANEAEYLENRLANRNRPNAFQNVVNFGSIWDEPRKTAAVDAVPPTQKGFRIELMPGLGTPQYDRILTALGARLGADTVHVVRREPDDVVLDLEVTKATLAELLDSVPSVLSASPQPRYSFGVRYGTASTRPEVPILAGSLPPPSGVVGVVDSGASAQNPWLAPYIQLHREWALQQDTTPQDTNGHGTKVSGLSALYDAMTTGTVPPGTNRVVVTNVDTGQGPIPTLEQETTAILGWLEAQGVRVANLSINEEKPVVGKKHSSWAEAIDRYTASNDILLVTSIGNITQDDLQDLSARNIQYPAYYDSPEVDSWRVCAPGDAANALTVGSVSLIDAPGPRIARHTWPSPHTRFAPLARMPYGKPDLAHEGGNWFRSAAGTISPSAPHCPQLLTVNPAAGLALRHADHLETSAGTSFSAPLVAWLAAQLRARHPDWSANLTRAIILQSARHVTTGFPRNHKPLVGFGVPNPSAALNSNSARITFTWQGTIPYGGAESIRFWVPTTFAQANGTKLLRITLACNPPVDRLHRRYQAATIWPSLHIPGVDQTPSPIENEYWTSMAFHSVRQGAWAFKTSRSKAMRKAGSEWLVNLQCRVDSANRGLPRPDAPTAQAYGLAVTLTVEDDAVDLPGAILQEWVRLRERQAIRT